MTKSIKLSESDWATLHDQLKKDYPKSVWLVREKMRRVLGFVPREHEVYSHDMGGPFWTHSIYLDFYDDKKKTMFLLKYGDFIKDDN